VTDRWEFGVAPLAQTEAAAGSLRRVTSLVLAMEQEDDAVVELIADLERAASELAAVVPPSSTPRVGAAVDGDGRPYLDHARDIGAYNPCFPAYELIVDGVGAAHGTVEFPVAYEGPPGFVHGGFLGLFADCVVQHHSCDVGVAGKTTAMTVHYRRPAPLERPLTFTIERTHEGDRLRSVVLLHDGDRLLCEAEVEAVAGNRADLPAVSPRRLTR
jgi:acyl-coenzyme A thioesterase PaaI-like protein